MQPKTTDKPFSFAFSPEYAGSGPERILLIFLLLFALGVPVIAQFSEVAGPLGVAIGGEKEGGVAWADFNQDGCLDIAVNTDRNNSSFRTRLYMGSCGGAFTDVTATHATGFRNAKTERSIIWADLNNDGYPDLARNTWQRFEIYINQGPSGSPAFSLGDGSHNPNRVITTIPNGMNTEGFGWLDYNGDGWLDLIVENHNFGIDIFENPANGTANFFHVTPNGNTRGLPSAATSGDFMALTDYNNDGNVDILARKENGLDLWENHGFAATPQFTANNSFNLNATNSNKGGVLFADFDNDGDFDIFWSDAPRTLILENTGFNSGNFVATAEPANSAFGGNFPASARIDGCAAGDVNNDGKIDLFMADRSGASYLLINTSSLPGQFSFVQNNMGINVGANAEGVAFGDYDNDGDLDLYINVDNRANQLWRNNLNNSNFLKVEVLRDFSSGRVRPDVGATIVMKDCAGNVVSGIREVNGTRGHGSQDHSKVHFGLPNGPTDTYLLEVGYTRVGGTRQTLQVAVRPDQLPGQELVLTTSDSDDLTLCLALPVTLLGFEAQPIPDGVELLWATASESGSDHFEIQHSLDGEHFSAIGSVDAIGNSSSQQSYRFLDRFPHPGQQYYRLKEIGEDGSEQLYPAVEAVWKGGLNLKIAPTLLLDGSVISVEWPSRGTQVATFELLDMKGRRLELKKGDEADRFILAEFRTEHLPEGIYLVRVLQGSHSQSRKVMVLTP